MIKLIHVIGSSGVGGVERLTLDILKGLDPSLYERHLCCPSTFSLEEAPVVKEAQSAGIKVIQVPMEGLFYRESLRELRDYIRTNKIQLIHTQSPMGGYFGRVAAWGLSNVKTIHTIQGHCYRDWLRMAPMPLFSRIKKRGFIAIESFLDARTDLLTFVAERDLQVYMKAGICRRGRKIIYNGVSLEEMKSTEDRSALRTRAGITSKYFIGTLVRLSVQKDLETFVRTAEAVCKKREDVQFGIVGDGEERERITRLIQELNLEQKCLFLSTGRDRQESLNFLGAFDVFLLTSLWEGLPVTILEAAAMGIPIVATDVNGTSDFLRDHQEGLLIPPRDAFAAAEAVRYLLDHPQEAKEMAERSRRRVKMAFTTDKMVAQFDEEYQRLIRKLD